MLGIICRNAHFALSKFGKSSTFNNVNLQKKKKKSQVRTTNYKLMLNLQKKKWKFLLGVTCRSAHFAFSIFDKSGILCNVNLKKKKITRKDNPRLQTPCDRPGILQEVFRIFLENCRLQSKTLGYWGNLIENGNSIETCDYDGPSRLQGTYLRHADHIPRPVGCPTGMAVLVHSRV